MIKLLIQKNNKGLDALKKRLTKLQADDTKVSVGLLADGKARKGDDELTNAEIGAVHEYGAPDAGIPKRPWLRPGVEKNHKLYHEVLAKAISLELEGKSALTKSLNLIGAKAAADVKAYVTQGPEISPTNSPRTKAIKEKKRRKGSVGSTRTLVDSSQMINGVTWRVGSEKGKGSK